MLQAKINAILEDALRELGIKETIDYKIDLPPRKEMGDYASNIALLYAHKLSRNPFDVAKQIVEAIHRKETVKTFDKIEIARPGFINFFFKDDCLREELLEVKMMDHLFGGSERYQGEKVLLEFVSANPTGPLHVGHGRWAVIGDVIGRILSAVGYVVTREYYVNNIGNQVDKLWESVIAVREGKDIPEGGYGGWYIKEIMGRSKSEVVEEILSEQKLTLGSIGLKYDDYYHESDLHNQNKVKMAVQKLHDLGKTFEEDGAIWFKSQELGDDKNRVLIREDGQPTYFAADIAYHLDKYNRGYNCLINIWGTDHHGYVNRLKSALKVLGCTEEKLEIIIGQLVTLYRGDEQVRMSKRTGEMITLDEVIDEIGKDALRYFFSATDVNSHLDFDLELAKKQNDENPVYYIQYAHARICSILKKSSPPIPLSTKDGEGDTRTEGGRIDLSSLNHPAERELILKILSFPDVVETAAQLRHPHRLTEYAKELAAVFHHFYEKCRVLGDPGRIFLVDTSRITLRNVLELLGIDAPESM